jgi:F0F1-type ATP synthase membrane subunit b/b'
VSLRVFAALTLVSSAEGGESFLGLPMWIWQLANLIAFLGVLGYFVARPLAQAFARRQQAVEERIVQARKWREEAARLETEIHERMARLDRDLADVRARGLAEGESAREALTRKADEEVVRVRREAEQEIARRLAFAREELRRAAADLTSSSALARLSSEITDEDRRRLLEEAVLELPQRS